MSLQVARGSALGSIPTAFKKMRDGGNGSLNGMIQKDAVGKLVYCTIEDGFFTEKIRTTSNIRAVFEAVYELQ